MLVLHVLSSSPTVTPATNLLMEQPLVSSVLLISILRAISAYLATQSSVIAKIVANLPLMV
jgi:hypothetical protein